jgi:hypothetical protein
MTSSALRLWRPIPLLVAALLMAALAYWPGLFGGWLFDDYPNIVDNHGVQPADASLGSLVRAALSSPASDFKRPLASLSFAANYLATGLDPFGMKLTNLAIHLLNGLLVFLLTRPLLAAAAELVPGAGKADETERTKWGIWSALVAAGWMLLPINLTGVLYVVQRMESLANLFVLLGLWGYVAARRRMLAGRGGLWLAAASLVLPTGVGLLAKETAVLLPLYALAVEWALFRFRAPSPASGLAPDGNDGSKARDKRTAGKASAPASAQQPRRDWRIVVLFTLLLFLPMIVGLAWLLPGLLKPQSWATRDFTLGTRLLSEARIVADYVAWTLLPVPQALSFYHDDFVVSSGLLHPWTTLPAIVAIVVLVALPFMLRRRWPLAALGLGLYVAAHTLTATILPLELIYEHRNYFASYGLLLVVLPALAAGGKILPDLGRSLEPSRSAGVWACRIALAALMMLWTVETAVSARAWGDPLRLAQELAARSPASPRSQYELGRTYIIYSGYDPQSPYTALAYAPLERAAALPESSILPQQALIFMNSRMGLPLKDAWWDSMTAKLAARPSGVQDDSSLAALSQCARERHCDLPKPRMVAAFQAALGHPRPSPRLLATYSDYAWNVLGDKPLGEQMIERAIQAAPAEPAYRITLIRMLVVLGRTGEAEKQYAQLKAMNLGGRLDRDLAGLRDLLAQDVH